MRDLKAFNLKQWIDEHRDVLKPPVCNKLIFQDAGFIVMVIGGPNERKDYHFDESEEFFYQVEGDMVLRVMQNGKPADIPIREGEVFLLPAKVPHSPQRKANTVGLVIERERMDGEQDGLIWFCENCHHKLYAEYFKLENIETQLSTVFDRFYGSLDDRTCDKCATVMERP
ncbi:MAG TPA: 3-hydroxyanthranilate 3,4-dioxygenase [Acidobacteria bacterium]|jgi:3-hydroxyanthranilate 3,4-dioxygenase|nr:3-hydroxyanthranilate 3,4-dioxygenase [Acidobacteriota bacterium]MDP6371600.1 3-hydroxyanthranilate 3,4-dioxygenase [Vicinamibacterales bacterium]HAK55360.1 3-hydroxyanthranilate 3,4-dioxygenase [Acidobacteriota bacterium]|tara:strand:+ start:7080 stop:7592 length:513 start_codon:yes stop_codon:yes gene_type:complete